MAELQNSFWNHASQTGTLLIVLGAMAYVYYFLERKIGADLQARVGPASSGAAGIFQPAADGLRWLLRASPDSLSNMMGVSLRFALSVSRFLFLPLLAAEAIVQSSLSLFLLGATLLIQGFFSLSSRMKTGQMLYRIGVLRNFSCVTAAAPSLFIGLLVVVSLSGSADMAAFQKRNFAQWLVWQDPLQAFNAVCLGVSMFVCLGLPPFDESSRNVGESGLKRILIRGGEILDILFVATFSVCVFLGGAPVFRVFDDDFLSGLLSFVIFMIKLIPILFFILVMGRVMPRTRRLEVARFASEKLVPLSIALLALSSFWKLLI